ncbi:MAG: hypothetical protein MJ252_18585 [archaeon]|nr:hypothetical protein [archaeon]
METDIRKQDTNELIPILIDKIIKVRNRMKHRIKANGFFHEFDGNTRRDLQKFIKFSSKRYKSAKSGTSINQVLNKMNPDLDELANRICNDEFYQIDDIEKESKKLLIKADKSERKEILEIINQIKQNTKAMSNTEMEKRKE